MPARTLFKVSPRLPEGLIYKEEFLDAAEEDELLEQFASLGFAPFQFQQYTAKRRVVEYGWEFDFQTRTAAETRPIPNFLEPLRARAAEFAAVRVEEIAEAIVTEYVPGTP